MATQSTINKNAEALRKKGAPDSVVKQYIALAQKEKSGIDKTIDVGKEVVRGIGGFFAAPASLISEGVRFLTKTEPSKIEKWITDFAFEGTRPSDKNDKRVAGVALERAIDGASLITGPATKGMGLLEGANAVGKYGAKLGASYGLANTLQEDDAKLGDYVTNILLGAGLGYGAGAGMYTAGKGIGYGAQKIKQGATAVKEGSLDLLSRGYERYKQAKEYSALVNDKGLIKRVAHNISDMLIDVDPVVADKVRGSESIKNEVRKQLTSKADHFDNMSSIWNEMRDEVTKLDDNVSAEFSKIQSEVLGERGTEKLQKPIAGYFEDILKQFDPGSSITVVDGNPQINFSGKISKQEQKLISKIFTDEVVSRENDINNLVDLARIADKGIPDDYTSKTFTNFRKSLGGYLRDSADQVIKDERWTNINNKYGDWADFYSRITDITKSNTNTPGPKQLDEILTQLARTVKATKSGRSGILKELDSKSGKNFYDRVVANEYLRSVAKQKGVKGAQNLVSGVLRIADPGKYLSLSLSLNPSKTVAGVGNVAKAFGSTAVDGVKSVYNTSSGATAKLSEMIAALALKAGDENLSKGLRLFYLLTLKELMFPSPNFSQNDK